MIKQIQTINRQQRTNCLRVFDHFVRLLLKGLGHFDQFVVLQMEPEFIIRSVDRPTETKLIKKDFINIVFRTFEFIVL